MAEFDYQKAKQEAKEYVDDLEKVERAAAEAFNQQVRREMEASRQLDINGEGPTIVELEIRADGEVVWLNVNGITRCRVCRISHIHITDHRSSDESI